MLQLKEPNVSKARVVNTRQNIKQPPIWTRLKTINTYASPPFVIEWPKRNKDIGHLSILGRRRWRCCCSQVDVGVGWCSRAWCSILMQWSYCWWSGVVLLINHACNNSWDGSWVVGVFNGSCRTPLGLFRRLGVKLEALGEAISNENIFRTEHCEALPNTLAGFLSNKRILGGEVADTIDINKKTLHLAFHPIMMPIMLLMKRK